MNFAQAKKLIEEKGDLSQLLADINFGINEVFEDVDFNFHDSNTYENEYKTTKNLTLLHVAIIASNAIAVNILIQGGADSSLSLQATTERRNRHAISGEGLFNTAQWSDWSDWGYSGSSTKTCGELAENNAEVLAYLEESSSHSLTKK